MSTALQFSNESRKATTQAMDRRTNMRRFGVLAFLLFELCLGSPSSGQDRAIRTSVLVLDPRGHPVPRAHLELQLGSGAELSEITSGDGTSLITVPIPGVFTVNVEAHGFASITKRADFTASSGAITLQFDSSVC
jgi:hypothetical protein